MRLVSLGSVFALGALATLSAACGGAQPSAPNNPYAQQPAAYGPAQPAPYPAQPAPYPAQPAPYPAQPAPNPFAPFMPPALASVLPAMPPVPPIPSAMIPVGIPSAFPFPLPVAPPQ